MNLPMSMKAIIRCLVLIFATVLINANPVFGADRVGDAQMQARDLLAGTVGGRPKTLDKSFAIAADRHQQSYPDPQTQARHLILGKSSIGGAVSREFAVQSKANVAEPVSAQRIGAAHTDPQELARRMILGAADSRREGARVRLSGIQEIEK